MKKRIRPEIAATAGDGDYPLPAVAYEDDQEEEARMRAYIQSAIAERISVPGRILDAALLDHIALEVEELCASLYPDFFHTPRLRVEVRKCRFDSGRVDALAAPPDSPLWERWDAGYDSCEECDHDE